MHPDEGATDKNTRIILAVVFIGLAAFRLIRYVQIGTGKRRISAIPSTSVPITNPPTPSDADLIPAPKALHPTLPSADPDQ
jgi:hypothetical protein